MSWHTFISNPSAANSVIVEQRLNNLSSELDILMMQTAESVKKIDVLLFTERFKKELSQDQEIDLGNLKAQLLKIACEVEQVKKRI